MKLLLAMLPTILLTIYGQLVVKWRVSKLHATHETALDFKSRITLYLTDPYILSAFACSFLAAVAWFYVVERYPVSIAFPSYVGVLFIFVLMGSALFLREPVSLMQLVGIALIIAGVYIASRTVHG